MRKSLSSWRPFGNGGNDFFSSSSRWLGRIALLRSVFVKSNPHAFVRSNLWPKRFISPVTFKEEGGPFIVVKLEYCTLMAMEPRSGRFVDFCVAHGDGSVEGRLFEPLFHENGFGSTVAGQKFDNFYTLAVTAGVEGIIKWRPRVDLYTSPSE